MEGVVLREVRNYVFDVGEGFQRVCKKGNGEGLFFKLLLNREMWIGRSDRGLEFFLFCDYDMKKLGFILILLIGMCTMKGNSQNADQRIRGYIDQQDWFALDAAYPVLKDSLSDPMWRWYSQAMLGVCFNRPDEAMVAIDTLLLYYQPDIGFSDITDMVYLKSLLLEQRGDYSASADLLADFLSQVSLLKPEEELEGIRRYYGYMKSLRKERAPVLKRPKREVTVPVTIEKAGRGDHLYVPVKVRGKTYSFIFDTGAEKTILSQRYADLLGVRVVYDSLRIAGGGGEFKGKLGIIDCLEIGGIRYKNMVVAITPPSSEPDSLRGVDAVLGCDFMKAVGEIQILPKEGRIVFPYLSSSGAEGIRNMMYNFVLPYVEAYSGDERLIFQFDMGNVVSDLNFPFYEKHKEWVEHYGIPEAVQAGGLGGIYTMGVYRLRSFPLRVGDVDFEMKNLNVNAETLLPIHRAEDGSLGMSFVQLFDRVLLNFKDMFFKVVK